MVVTGIRSQLNDDIQKRVFFILIMGESIDVWNTPQVCIFANMIFTTISKRKFSKIFNFRGKNKRQRYLFNFKEISRRE